MFRWLSSFRVEVFLLFAALLAVSSVVLLNDVSIYVRLKELKVYLQNIDRVEDNLDQLQLVLAYRVNKQLYNGEISKDQSDMVEYNVSRILDERPQYRSVSIDRYSLLAIPVITVINGFRYITGRPAIKDIPESRWDKDFEIAYYYERNRLYKKSVTYYQKALQSSGTMHLLRGTILLHMGFSYAMISDYRNARMVYKQVLEEYSGEPSAITAGLLLRYLDGFQSEVKKILSQKKKSIISAERLYLLHAYHDSLEMLDHLNRTATPEELKKINYYRAYCYERTGKSRKATSLYLAIISDNPDSVLSKYAARRLYVMSTTGTRNTRISRLSKKMSLMFDDTVLSQMVAVNTRITGKSGNEPGTARGVIISEIQDKPAHSVETGYDHSMIKMAEDALNKNFVLEEIPAGKKKISSGNRKVRIFMKDGTLFVGSIIGRSGGTMTLKTVLGKLSVPENKVEKIEQY
ncbi:MAG TPA: tetratricopeptide repeat protein [Spirochaetota bacterium]|nr:tetratricopeptide repeat protein [Spirochaetota bacterium]HPQ54193.1 tetratricopeptide repeat protein [Spirochaetota bacterium]